MGFSSTDLFIRWGLLHADLASEDRGRHTPRDTWQEERAVLLAIFVQHDVVLFLGLLHSFSISIFKKIWPPHPHSLTSAAAACFLPGVNLEWMNMTTSNEGGDHIENHFTAGDMVKDIIIGMSDGLTVPFALAAGLSGAQSSSTIVVTAGLAEVAAGAIAMGLGGYLAAKSDVDHYNRERQREEEEILTIPESEAEEVAEILGNFGLQPEEYYPIVESLKKRPEAWLEFMMRFELGLEKPDPGRAIQSAITIALSYIVGGMIPLAPYMLISHVKSALRVSIAVTILALLIFGFVKGKFTGSAPWKSSFQTALIGAIASATAFGIAWSVQVWGSDIHIWKGFNDH